MKIDPAAELEDMALAIYSSFYIDGAAFSKAHVTECFGEGWTKTDFILAAQAALTASHAHRLLPEVMTENERLRNLLEGFVTLIPEPPLVSMGFDSPPEYATEDEHQLGYFLFLTRQALSHQQQKDEG